MPKLSDSEYLCQIIQRLSKSCEWGAAHLPCDYLVLDIETTGFSSVNDRVVSLGMCAVEGCEISHELHSGDYTNIILKWPEEVFNGKGDAIAVHGIDYAKSQEYGVDPSEAMSMLSLALEWARNKGMYIVGHNLQKFDAPFLTMEMSRAGIDMKIEHDEVLDTAALCKAMQLGMLPSEDESVFEYFERVLSFRAKGVYFNLDRYCIGRFELDKKYGAGKDKAHNSGYDCWLTHLVVSEMNKIVNAATE